MSSFVSTRLVELRFVLLHRLGLPELWLCWPVGVVRGMRALMSPARCLSSFEYWTRHYYEHIAGNFKTAGRWGYVWDEALGAPFGPRIYNNLVTYWLFGALSARAFRLLTVAAYLGAIVGLGIANGHGALGLALAALLLGSPAGLHALVGCMIKPEVPWWSLALVAAACALSGHWAIALAAGGMLLLANGSVAAITAMLLAPLWLHAAWTSGALPGGPALWWVVPGLLKTLFRILQARADGMGRGVAAEQKKVRRARPTIRELADLLAWFALPLLISASPLGVAGLLVGAAAVLFWAVNKYAVKLADNVTVLMALLSMLLAAVLVTGDWRGIWGVAWFAFYRPFSAFVAIAGRGQAEAARRDLAADLPTRLRALQGLAKAYPWLSTAGVPEADPILRLLRAIPPGARVLLESDGDGRGAGSHLHLRNWAASVLRGRQVELVNQYFLVRLLEPHLAERYLDHFSVKTLDGATMALVCRALGVSRLLVFTPETRSALEQAGFQAVGTIGADEMGGLADLLHMPPTGVTLLAAKGDPGVIEPGVAWTRGKNVLRWAARAGEQYVVRYRYHRQFQAWQGEVPIEVSPAAVIDGLPLRFMRVTAVSDGPLELRFSQPWFG